MTLTILITTPSTARPRARPLREQRHKQTGLPSLCLSPSRQWYPARSRHRRAQASLSRLLTSPRPLSCPRRARASLPQLRTSPRSRSHPRRAQASLSRLLTSPRPLSCPRRARASLPQLRTSPWSRSHPRRAQASLSRLLTSPQPLSCPRRARASLPQCLTSHQQRPPRVQVLSLWRRPFLKTPCCRLLVQTTMVCQPLVNRLQGYGEHGRGGTSTPRR